MTEVFKKQNQKKLGIRFAHKILLATLDLEVIFCKWFNFIFNLVPKKAVFQGV